MLNLMNFLYHYERVSTIIVIYFVALGSIFKLYNQVANFHIESFEE